MDNTTLKSYSDACPPWAVRSFPSSACLEDLLSHVPMLVRLGCAFLLEYRLHAWELTCCVPLRNTAILHDLLIHTTIHAAHADAKVLHACALISSIVSSHVLPWTLFLSCSDERSLPPWAVHVPPSSACDGHLMFPVSISVRQVAPGSGSRCHISDCTSKSGTMSCLHSDCCIFSFVGQMLCHPDPPVLCLSKRMLHGSGEELVGTCCYWVLLTA
jgi:hypothetical protein